MENIFEIIATGFTSSKLRHVLIGGFAVNFYTAGRQTKDVDFMVATEDREKAISVLKKAGYDIIDSQSLFIRMRKPGDIGLIVDFVFVDSDSLAEIIKNGKTVKLSKRNFIIPSLNHLIAMKLHAIKQNKEMRETKDLPDILTLIKENKIDIEDSHFKELCLKYGSEETYQKIKIFFE